MHLSDLQQQEQQQLNSIQSQIFWQGVWRACQHRQTNDLLAQNNELQARNNALLEQIRRGQLTPAERAAEDRARTIEAARLALEAERKAEREALLTRRTCLVLGAGTPIALALVTGALIWILLSLLLSSVMTYLAVKCWTPKSAAKSVSKPAAPQRWQQRNWQCGQTQPWQHQKSKPGFISWLFSKA